MTEAFAFTFTVTQVDVLYVMQQVQRDLRRLAACYPDLLDDGRILSVHDGLSTLVMNDVIATLGFSVEDPRNNHLVYHELRYPISYTGDGPRHGSGGRDLVRQAVTGSTVFTPWVIWNSRMLALSVEAQRKAVAGTGWSIPGTHVFHPTYGRGSWVDNGEYRSGPLVLGVKEYRSDLWAL